MMREKKIKRQYMILAIVGMFITGGLTGCIEEQGEEEQQTSSTVFLTIDDNNSTVEVPLGNMVNLTLEQNGGSTGYVWNITAYNETILSLVDHFTWGVSEMLGASSNETWLFTTNTTGTTLLSLVYKQPWMENGDSTNYTVNITVIQEE